MAQKFLRGIGITLIALPEPFTTPLGAAFLLASYVESKKQKADSWECLEKVVQSYVSRYQPFGQGALPLQPKVIHHVINRSPAQSPTGSRTDLGSNTQVYSWSNSPRTRGKVIHHTLDRNLFLLAGETPS